MREEIVTRSPVTSSRMISTKSNPNLGYAANLAASQSVTSPMSTNLNSSLTGKKRTRSRESSVQASQMTQDDDSGSDEMPVNMAKMPGQ